MSSQRENRWTKFCGNDSSWTISDDERGRSRSKHQGTQVQLPEPAHCRSLPAPLAAAEDGLTRYGDYRQQRHSNCQVGQHTTEIAATSFTIYRRDSCSVCDERPAVMVAPLSVLDNGDSPFKPVDIWIVECVGQLCSSSSGSGYLNRDPLGCTKP